MNASLTGSWAFEYRLCCRARSERGFDAKEWFSAKSTCKEWCAQKDGGEDGVCEIGGGGEERIGKAEVVEEVADDAR